MRNSRSTDDAQVNESLFLKWIGDIRPGTSDGARAPHKPLLLLLALARAQRNDDRLMTFSETEPRLNALLRSYGKSGYTDARLPFWHLKNDALWEIPDIESLKMVKPGKRPTMESLRENGRGGFIPAVHKLLKERPSLSTRAAKVILRQHFPESLHDELLNAVGLDVLGPSGRRDPQFRTKVLNAYGHRCGVCGFDPHIDGMAVGLEAAHIRWHKHKGPSSIDNGVALCPLHHKCLDLGLMGFTTDRRVLISKRVSGGSRLESLLGYFHGMPLRPPAEASDLASPYHIEWHQREVFKHPHRIL
jgi:putative restriction endonuclease